MNNFKLMFALFVAIMRSERGSVGGDMGGMEKYLDDTNLEGLGVEESAESESVDQDQPGEGEESNEEDAAKKDGDGKPTLEEQLAEFGKDAEGKAGEGENGLLDQLNELGILRKGMPVEFDDVEKVKEMLSKGFDYTYEKQQLADQRREQEETFTQREQEIASRLEEVENYRKQLDEQVLENQVMGQILAELKQNDPDIFNELQSAYQQRMGMFNMQNNHPALKQYGEKISELEKALQQTTQQKQQEESQSTVKEWEEGLNGVQKELGGKLRKMGVRPDWSKVKEVWQSDASGSTSVRQALLAVHGEQMLKAMESQSKLNQTKAKSAQRMGPQGSGSNNSKEQAPSQHGERSYMGFLEEVARKHA